MKYHRHFAVPLCRLTMLGILACADGRLMPKEDVSRVEAAGLLVRWKNA